jgi:hypothetical protein
VPEQPEVETEKLREAVAEELDEINIKPFARDDLDRLFAELRVPE